MTKRNKLNHTIDLSSGLDMWSFKLKDFYSVAVEMFNKNIYTYLENVPNLKNLNISKESK